MVTHVLQAFHMDSMTALQHTYFLCRIKEELFQREYLSRL